MDAASTVKKILHLLYMTRKGINLQKAPSPLEKDRSERTPVEGGGKTNL